MGSPPHSARQPDAKEAATIALGTGRCLKWLDEITRRMESRRMSARSDFARSVYHAQDAMRELERVALELAARRELAEPGDFEY